MAFTGKVVLVTGGGNGIGRLAAQTLANKGANVAIFDINTYSIEETAKNFDNIYYWTVDITDAGASHQAVIEVEKTLGPIDRLYNAAGIVHRGKILEQNIDTMHAMMDVNYNGLVNIIKAVLPGMLQRRSGDFISFSSMAGLVPTMLTGAYSASKAAVAILSETLYHENINSGIRFACVCAPAIDTRAIEPQKNISWLQIINTITTPVAPKDIIEAIEVALDKGNFWVYPGKQTRISSLVRRFCPSIIWKQAHNTEEV